MMKIISHNVRAWTRDWLRLGSRFWMARAKRMREYFRSENPDIICLQEVRAPFLSLLGLKDYEKFEMSGGPVLVKRGKNIRLLPTIINVHLSLDPAEMDRQLKDLQWELSGNEDIIVAGDFNAGWQAIRERMQHCTHARQFLGYEQRDTFVNWSNPASHGEIDHFVLKGIKPLSFRVDDKTDFSDHYPIVMTF